MLGDIAAIVAPILIAAAVGYGWARSGRPFDTNSIGRLNVSVGTPCLVFSTLATIPLTPQALGQMALAAGLCLVGFGLVGFAALRLSGQPWRDLLPSLMLPNTGNMGLPLSLFAFGDEGLALAIAFFVVYVAAQFTVGVAIASGRANPVEFLKTPIPYAIVLGLAFPLALGVPPTWLQNSAKLIGAFTIPMMLLALGVALARFKLVRIGPSLALGALRLGMGAGIGWGVAELLGLEGTARGVLILQAGMPVAVYNFIFAQRYGRDEERVAALVLASTLLSFLTLPLLLAALLPGG